MTTTTVNVNQEIALALGRYESLLLTLGREEIRTERAALLLALAAVADTLADLTKNTGSEGDMTIGNTLAWRDTWTLLTRLAQAENGSAADADMDEDSTWDFQEWRVWADLRTAATASEYADGIKAVTAYLTANAPYVSDRAPGGTPRTQPFALAKFTEAAAACAAGYPDTYMTEQDYRTLHTASSR
jgi:hypothetical protein